MKALICGALLLAGAGMAGPMPAVSGELSLAPQSGARFQCGPTTLAAVLAFWGDPVPEAAITAVTFSPTARGVLLTDLAAFARQRGFQTLVRTGTVDDLARAVAERQPPIVLLDLGLGRSALPHFTVLLGWSDAGVRYQNRSPTGKRVSNQTFMRQWQRAGNQYLLITPSS
jgi:predicted double-glycine peptidase